MQLATRSLQLTTCNLQLAGYNLQLTTCNLQPTPCNTQLKLTYNLQLAACNLQLLQIATYNLQTTTRNVHSAARAARTDALDCYFLTLPPPPCLGVLPPPPAPASKIAKNPSLFNIFGFPGLTKATKVAYVLHFPGLQRFGSRETAF